MLHTVTWTKQGHEAVEGSLATAGGEHIAIALIGHVNDLHALRDQELVDMIRRLLLKAPRSTHRGGAG